MRSIVLTIVVTLSLFGCAATPYQKSEKFGYSEKQLTTDVYRVRFAGSEATSFETVQTYWLYRAAEIALEHGYDGFEILSDLRLSQNISPEKLFGSENKEIKPAVFLFIPIPSAPHYFPVLQGDIKLLKNPIIENPPKIFISSELKKVLEKFVQAGKKCQSDNVCPHVHEYLYPKGKFEKSL